MQLNAKIFAFVLSISLTSCIPSSGKGSKSVRKSNLTVADSNSNRNDGVSDDFGASILMKIVIKMIIKILI